MSCNINMFKRVCTELGMEEIVIDTFQNENISILYMFLGKNPESLMYGKIIGFFKYIDGRIFRIFYQVHKPNQKYPQLSNQMTSIELIRVSENTKSYTGYMTNFGAQAFCKHTPDRYLCDVESKDLRTLMRAITQYSREHDLCKQFRKTDRVALQVNALYKENES